MEAVCRTTRGTRIALRAVPTNSAPPPGPAEAPLDRRQVGSGLLRKRGPNGQGVVHEAAESARLNLSCTLQHRRRAQSNGQPQPSCGQDGDADFGQGSAEHRGTLTLANGAAAA